MSPRTSSAARLSTVAFTLILGISACQSPTQTPATAAPDTVASAPAEAAAPSATPFHKSLQYQQISFEVHSPGTAQGNTVTITPKGLSISNEAQTMDITGLVTDAVVDDIDGDNSPELAVLVHEGADKKGKALVFTTFKGKSFGMVNFPDVTDTASLKGYQGGDEYNFVENRFVRRFPLMENGQKTGKMRQFQFKMVPGEAMKQLVLDKQVEF